MYIRTAAAAAALAATALLGGAGIAAADSDAQGSTANSSGLVAGNNIQVPVHVPVNVCGTSVDVIGLLNPANGECVHADH